MSRVTIEVDNPQEVIKEALWLAWNACGGPMGMGAFQDNGGASKEDIWNNVANAGDYPGPSHSRPNEIHGDYVFGRMMKIWFDYDDKSITVATAKQEWDYQAWSGTYPTYPELIAAAVKSLEEQSV